MTNSVYVLLSLKDKRTYVGSTPDLKRRLNEHNTGRVKSTRLRRPLQLVFSEGYDTIERARKREKYYKSAAGRKKLKQIVFG